MHEDYLNRVKANQLVKAKMWETLIPLILPPLLEKIKNCRKSPAAVRRQMTLEASNILTTGKVNIRSWFRRACKKQNLSREEQVTLWKASVAAAMEDHQNFSTTYGVRGGSDDDYDDLDMMS